MLFRCSKKRRTGWDSGTRRSARWCAPRTTPIVRRMTQALRKAILVWAGAAVMHCALPSMAQLDRIPNSEAVAGLNAAREERSQHAVARPRQIDGLLGQPHVGVPLARS